MASADVTVELRLCLLWRPIVELDDKYRPNLLVYAPELIDLDFNPSGAGMAHFQDGGLDGDVEAGQFLANKWNGTNDEWMLVPCTPTHFVVLEPPLPKQHRLYETGDEDAPGQIRDRNGEVVLGLCRDCGRAEIELSEPCTPDAPPAR